MKKIRRKDIDIYEMDQQARRTPVKLDQLDYQGIQEEIMRDVKEDH